MCGSRQAIEVKQASEMQVAEYGGMQMAAAAGVQLRQ